MFRHHGKARTLNHNKKIASLLSFVAGTVNVAGFLSVQRLTTNVTGHFAFFVDEVFKLHLVGSIIFFAYILFFFLGSYISSMLVEAVARKGEQWMYIIPVMLETVILLSVACTQRTWVAGHTNLVACSLLFAMGLQNSLVTRISSAMVRTTHLTGLFTDLGIELSQLSYYKEEEQRGKLLTTIKLRLRIIVYFFLGGLAGGISYTYMGIHVLYIPAALLAMGLYYDSIKLKLLRFHRKYNRKMEP